MSPVLAELEPITSNASDLHPLELTAQKPELEKRIHEKELAPGFKTEITELATALGVPEEQFEVVAGLLDQLIDYSPEHANHSMRVAIGTLEAAKLLGADTNQAFIAGLLHDVGKLVVPLEVLEKPGKFNNYDRQKMSIHSKAGYKIARHYGFSNDISLAIGAHHNLQEDPYGIDDNRLTRSSRLIRDAITIADHIDAAWSRNDDYESESQLNHVMFVLDQDTYGKKEISGVRKNIELDESLGYDYHSEAGNDPKINKTGIAAYIARQVMAAIIEATDRINNELEQLELSVH